MLELGNMNKTLEKVIRISGKLPGTKSVILVGVHGNESCGIDAINKLLPDLKIDQGHLTIAFGNPRAIEMNTRLTEENLNRMFLPEQELTDLQKRSYEYKRAIFLKNILSDSEVLLDIHASNNPNSKPFIICEQNSRDIYKYIPIDTVVNGFDLVEPGGTDYFMNSIGKTGLCIECGYINDLKSTKVAIDSILAFLKIRGHINQRIQSKKQNVFKVFLLYKTSTDNFTLLKPLADFEQVKKNQIIGLDGVNEVTAPEDSIILFAKNTSLKGSEAFLLGRRVK